MYDVVLIDDEAMIVNGLSKAFPWEQYRCRVVGTASDGREGIKVIERLRPHLVVTDIRMPNLDGLNMIAALESEFPDLKIIVLTAFRDFDYAQKAIRLGVFRYLLKPSRMDELHEAVAEATDALGQEAPIEQQKAQKANEAGNLVVETALHYLNQNYAQHLTLSEVAEQVYVSQWHLSKLLNQHTGKNFSELIHQRRVQRAKELLFDPAYSVSDIAYQVGYQDTAHFCRVFKRLTSLSPMAYRNQPPQQKDPGKNLY